MTTNSKSNAKQILCVRLRNWPIDCLRRQLARQGEVSNLKSEISDSNPTPLVLIHTVASRELVTALCNVAFSHGVRAGMPLAEARALCPNLRHATHDANRDLRALEALARWMMRFTPIVSLPVGAASADGTSHPPQTSGSPTIPSAKADPTQLSQSCLFLDLTGSERVFGSMPKLLSKIAAALRQLRLDIRLAIAPNPGAAWALTFSRKTSGIFVESDLAVVLPPLSINSLRIESEIVAALRHLGIETIAQLLELPRQTLPARFGPLLLQRLDQAFGNIPEPLVPLLHHHPIQASIDFDGVIQSPEALHEIFKQLIARIIADLLKRGCGARQLDATFLRPDTAPIQKTIHLSSPSRDPINIFNLLRCAMETMNETQARGGHLGSLGRRDRSVDQRSRPLKRTKRDIRREHFQPEGFIGLRLAVPVFERLTDEQIFLLDQESQAAAHELDRLIERLRTRLGEEILTQARLVESHLPEAAWEIQTRDHAESSRGKSSSFSRRAPVPRLKQRPKTRLASGGIGHGSQASRLNVESPDEPEQSQTQARSFAPLRMTYPSSPCPFILSSSPPTRPLHLLPTPIEILVMVSPSDDRDGRPISFTHEGEVHPVIHAVGPERIGGPWWTGRHKTRDYFDAADPEGRRFWLFRVAQTSKWYLHGVFE